MYKINYNNCYNSTDNEMLKPEITRLKLNLVEQVGRYLKYIVNFYFLN